tara:strand:+ start:120 stop:473 length:354 start_codon:yes stop_codon:yes gene_type:complete
MNEIINVISLLKANFTESVYDNNIPESISKPCLAVTELSNSSKRVIEGVKYGLISEWRVTVYVVNEDDFDLILEKLDELDNTSNNDFQRIFSQYVLTEPKQQGQILTRAFVDLTLYK